MNETSDNSQRLIKQSIEVYIALALVTLLACVSYTFISPFLSILLWATILAVSLYPLFIKLSQWFDGRETLASIFIAVLSLLFLLAPTVLIALSAVESAAHLVEGLRNGTTDIPAPQESVKNWPLIGEKAFQLWNDAHLDIQATVQDRLPQIRTAAAKIVSVGTAILGGVLQGVLAIIFASVFLSYTKPLSRMINAVAKRIDSNPKTDFVQMAVYTTRNVSKGIIGTAIIQGGLAALGFFVIGLPFPGLWAIAGLAASIIQVPALVILPAIIYVWNIEPAMVALIFTVYMLPVMVSDNVLKPILMTQGLTTPIMIILIGVVGGTLSLGILGLFIGPVVLAVFYEMIRLWVNQAET